MRNIWDWCNASQTRIGVNVTAEKRTHIWQHWELRAKETDFQNYYVITMYTDLGIGEIIYVEELKVWSGNKSTNYRPPLHWSMLMRWWSVRHEVACPGKLQLLSNPRSFMDLQQLCSILPYWNETTTAVPYEFIVSSGKCQENQGCCRKHKVAVCPTGDTNETSAWSMWLNPRIHYKNCKAVNILAGSWTRAEAGSQHSVTENCICCLILVYNYDRHVLL